MNPSIDASIDELLRDRFGFPAFREGQREAITALFEHKAALAVFPTGGGKSLCYQLPALAFEGLTLVVSPLIALMKDQIDALAAKGIAAARMDSSLSKDEYLTVVRGVRNGTLKLLYVAPERFANERFLALLKDTRISLFAVDEAHSISEWGHNFRPDYLKLARAAKEIGAERVLALTATATPAVVESICERFAIPKAGVVLTGFYRANLELRVTPVAAREKDRALVQAIRAQPAGSRIVYVTLQRTAERVAKMLADEGFDAHAYHAGMEPEDRARVQEAFMSSRESICVATIAFGMGIDKADVRGVLHVDLPKSLEGYSQEIGRAGRDGQPAVVELLACADDAGVLEGFACGDTPTRESLTGLVEDLFARGDTFVLHLSRVGDQHDLRPLVLRTALTHLELMDVIREGTPSYGTYQLKFLTKPAEIVAKFSGERADFVQGIFAAGRKGTTWLTLELDDVAAATGYERDRIVRMIDWLMEQKLVEAEAKDVRHRFTIASRAQSPEELAKVLAVRFAQHEEREIARIREVLALAVAAECQTNRLVAHFGERRAKACGHCSFCRTGKAVSLPARSPARDPATLVDVNAWRALVDAQPTALAQPRQRARFLCGLASPALSKAKLTRHKLFGALDGERFHDVLAWCA